MTIRLPGRVRIGIAIVCCCLAIRSAVAQLNNPPSAPGVSTSWAVKLSQKSSMVQSAFNLLITRTSAVRDPKLRAETLDAIQNTQTCIHHRANLSEGEKQEIVQTLRSSGLLDPQDEGVFPGGWMNGVFPAVVDDGGPCPHLPQPFFAAPGGAFGGHHSYPGGLPIHEANNQMAALNLGNGYRNMYGLFSPGLPLAKLAGIPDSEIIIERDWLIAAPAWHDWAKAIVFQWNSDGSEFREMQIGGNGATDNYGSPGDSRTGSHHILSIAETMKRGLAPGFVITQASAHSAPSGGNEYKVVNWLRAAAMIARIDPVRNGYLVVDQNGRARLPPLRRLGSIDLPASGQVNLLPEYVLHNLSDADYRFSEPALASIEIIMRELAPSFGFDPDDRTKYNIGFRNPILSTLTAERLFILYSHAGREGVERELEKARRHHVF
jgi:hypothetical protein